MQLHPLNIGTPATDRDLCLLRYDANGGSGSMNLDQLEDSQLLTVNGMFILILQPMEMDVCMQISLLRRKERNLSDGIQRRTVVELLIQTRPYSVLISTASDDVNGSDKQMVLYAQWEDLPRVTVSLDANGGAVEPNDKTVIYTGTYGELPVPTREGYDFEGWFTQKEDGEKARRYNRSCYNRRTYTLCTLDDSGIRCDIIFR